MDVLDFYCGRVLYINGRLDVSDWRISLKAYVCVHYV